MNKNQAVLLKDKKCRVKYYKPINFHIIEYILQINYILRPYAQDLLKILKQKFNLGIFSRLPREEVDLIMNILDPYY